MSLTKHSNEDVASRDAGHDFEAGSLPGEKPKLTADAAHLGVRRVEASEKVFGKYSKWCLFISIGLAAYIYSLDGTTTYTYLAYATSSFGDHTLISTIQVAQSIIVAVGKPVIAKIADVGSRGTAYLAVLIFYVVGYIVIASAHSVGTVAGGIIIYAVGYTGLQLLMQIIIADITTLSYRGMVSSMTSLPFIINAFVGSNISASIVEHSGWRWGYGMFAILIPVSIGPLVITLLWSERKAAKLGLAPDITIGPSAVAAPEEADHRSIWRKIYDVTEALDVVGLVLLAAAVALILLPLTLVSTAKGKWHNPSMIAMVVIGCCLLPVVGIWDYKFAKHPVLAMRFLRNGSVMGAAWIGFFDYVSFYLNYTYLYSFVIVVKDWSLVNDTYFSETQTVALTIFGISAGIAMRYLHRYKSLLVVGLAIRLLGAGIMIHSRGANASDAEVVWTQLLQGIGGGMAAVSIQVGAQASVPHADVGIATALVLLLTEIGGAVGQAIAGSIWSNTMPGKMAHYLPALSQTERDTLYGDITSVTALLHSDPTRQGVISAYSDVMRTMVIASTCIAVLPLIISLFMPNWYLGDQQNAVENVNLAGEPLDGMSADGVRKPAKEQEVKEKEAEAHVNAVA